MSRVEVEKEHRISVVLTDSRCLSRIRISLGSLLKNTHYRGHEIVFVGDRIWQDCIEGYEVEGYSNILEYLTYWIPKFVDAGFKFSLHVGDWNRDKIDGLPPVYECYSYGVEESRNDWVLVIGADKYLSPSWDYNIIKRLDQYDRQKFVFQPVVCECYIMSDEAEEEHSRDQFDYESMLGFRPLWKFEGMKYRESELIQHYEQELKDCVAIEKPSQRRILGFMNQVTHKDVTNKMRQFSLNGEMFNWQRKANEEFPKALDLEYDDNLLKIGVQKVGCLDTFIFHLNWSQMSNQFDFDLGEP